MGLGGLRDSETVAAVPVRFYEGGGWREGTAALIGERDLEIFVNGVFWRSVSSSGLHPEELAAGLLFTSRVIAAKGDILDLRHDGEAGRVRVAIKNIPQGEGRPSVVPGPVPDAPLSRPPKPDLPEPETILSLMERMVEAATLHDRTRGTHAAALADRGGLAVVREDVGRHNCIDMLAGWALFQGADPGGMWVFRTGRLSRDIVEKLLTMGVRVVCSLGVPTSSALDAAVSGGLMVIGSVRRDRLTLFTPQPTGD